MGPSPDLYCPTCDVAYAYDDEHTACVAWGKPPAIPEIVGWSFMPPPWDFTPPRFDIMERVSSSRLRQLVAERDAYRQQATTFAEALVALGRQDIVDVAIAAAGLKQEGYPPEG